MVKKDQYHYSLSCLCINGSKRPFFYLATACSKCASINAYADSGGEHQRKSF